VSAWEQPAWTRKDSGDMAVFSSYRATPQYTAEVANGGVMMTFAKIVTAPSGYETYKEPQRLDFAFVPVDARTVKGAYLMADAPAIGNVTITYRIPAASASAIRSRCTPLSNKFPGSIRVSFW
ncbi:MAG TPA: hypothetical protein VM871_04615, partial [Flavisolibacter sp.]|nr:hypothetical protein [Flavisolibacter sp.]